MADVCTCVVMYVSMCVCACVLDYFCVSAPVAAVAFSGFSSLSSALAPCQRMMAYLLHIKTSPGDPVTAVRDSVSESHGVTAKKKKEKEDLSRCLGPKMVLCCFIVEPR